jgi:lipopolysaccharide/colanic/teichoic acid biosynthesis glycosyltransferase
LIAKRLFDLGASLIGLALLAPLLLMLSVWIKVDSRGPVMFRQVRVGKAGRHFRIHKFRTMRVDAEKVGPQVTIGVDHRITAAGRFLRRYKLDELPQLIDVLVGSMSIVGPRPEVPRYMDLYPPDARTRILSVRPGITDWASIRFKDENAILGAAAEPERAYVEQIMPVKLRFYLEYVEQRSFMQDMKIVAATLAAVFGFR